MRTIFHFIAVSLDAYFEGIQSDLSWHNTNNAEFQTFVHEQNKSVDIVMMGHRTYDVMAAYWPTSETKRMDPITAQFMNESTKIVATHTPFDATWGPTSVVTDPVTILTELKKRPGKDIAILGSNMLTVSLLDTGLIDEYRIMTIPVAIGQGTPLLSGIHKRVDLTLKSVRQFDSGNVLHTYTHAAPAQS